MDVTVIVIEIAVMLLVFGFFVFGLLCRMSVSGGSTPSAGC